MVVGSCFLFALSLFTPITMVPVLAATQPYQAQTSPTGNVSLAPGEMKSVTLTFKNIGSKTWIGGRSATALYVYGSSSIFGNATWLKNDQPAVIDQARVAPGSAASVTFSVKAPSAPGTYSEKFLLAYGPNAWIKGSTVTVSFDVQKPGPSGTVLTRSVPAPTPAPAPAPAPVAVVADATTASTDYRATLVDKGGIEWQFDPAEHGIITVVFKNIGTQTWTNNGANYLSLYTWSPKYRVSQFHDYSWKTQSQAVVMLEQSIKPGQNGTFKLEVRAPDVPGSYTESFQLSAENKAWLNGGTVSFPIRVRSPQGYVPPNANASPTAGTQPTGGSTAGSYATVLLLTSSKTLTAPGNGRVDLTQGFKNAGTAIWNTRGLRFVSIAPALGSLSSVHDTSWATYEEPVRASGATKPGEVGFLNYTIKAPTKKGTYTASFQLMADGQDVSGGIIEIPITVTSDGIVDPTPIAEPGPVVVTPSSPSSNITAIPLNGDVSSLPNEPIIRVGLFRTTDNTIMARAVSGGFIATQNGATICTFGAGQIATEVYDRVNRVYKLSASGCTSQSTTWYDFVATDGISALEITDFSRPVSWLPGANDNKFRGKLELRYTPATDAVWIINELPIEYYLKGLGETSDVSPLEFQKALLTAARTYAMYHVNRGTKHADEFYTVDAHYDQVYLGYGQEARSPNIAAGVMATRGQIVTYNGVLAITPYYSRSDGRTRNWTEVWGGSGFPWLVSVPVPWDVGQTMWGHGVGLSARGALYMASKDNATYDQILKHFYTGTELRQAYK